MVNIASTQSCEETSTPLKEAWARHGVSVGKPDGEQNKPGDGQKSTGLDTAKDTVSLSEEGQKIVNLARGEELANAIRNAPKDSDKDFAATLREAGRDIFRITRLFGETIRASFNAWR